MMTVQRMIVSLVALAITTFVVGLSAQTTSNVRVERLLDAPIIAPGIHPVSYTHLTLPTNREV